MHLLPTNLGPLADVCEPKNTGGQFCLNGVRVQLHEDGGYTADATDSKILLRVTGPAPADAAEYPAHPGLADAPNGSAEALVPAAAWKKMMAMGAKLTRRGRPAAKVVAVKASRHVATFAATDGESYPTDRVELIQGRYAPVDDFVRPARFGGRTVTVTIDPKMMIRLLKAMSETCTDDAEPQVTIEVRGDGKPVYLKARKPDGTVGVGLLMPLSSGETARGREAREAGEESALVESLRKQVAELEGAVAPLTEENSRLAAEVNSLRRGYAELERDNVSLRTQVRELSEQLAALRSVCECGDHTPAPVAEPTPEPTPEPAAATATPADDQAAPPAAEDTPAPAPADDTPAPAETLAEVCADLAAHPAVLDAMPPALRHRFLTALRLTGANV